MTIRLRLISDASMQLENRNSLTFSCQSVNDENRISETADRSLRQLAAFRSMEFAFHRWHSAISELFGTIVFETCYPHLSCDPHLVLCHGMHGELLMRAVCMSALRRTGAEHAFLP